MTAAVIACAAVLIVAVYVHDRLSSVLRRRRHAPVMVTLKSGTAFKGVLVGDDRRAVVLGTVEMVDTGKPTPVDGEVVVPWSDVAYLQRL